MAKSTDFIWKSEDRIENFRNSYNGFSSNDSIYKRYHNENMVLLENRFLKIYNLPSDTPCRAVNSCMSALAILLLQNKNKKFYIHNGIYCESAWMFTLFDNITYESSDTYDYVICEPLSNPMLEKTDIKSVSDKAHSINAKVIVDNSMLTCYNYNPFTDGADVVIESITKYTDGHGDVMSGIIIGEDISPMARIMGCFIQPREAYLALRSLNTLPLRMEKHKENAEKVVEYLKTITDFVLWDNRIGVITCHIGSDALHKAIAKNCKLCAFEWTFGQTNTIIQPNGKRACESITEPYCDSYIRFSIGLEDVNDIIEDIKQAYIKAKFIDKIK